MQILTCALPRHAAKNASQHIKSHVEVCKCNRLPYTDMADIPVYSNYTVPKNLYIE